MLGTKDTGDPRQTRLSSLAPMEPEYETWVGWHPGSCGRQRRYLDRKEGFLEEEVIIIIFIKQLLCARHPVKGYKSRISLNSTKLKEYEENEVQGNKVSPPLTSHGWPLE